ncbi:MurR/RpiR family transcriptional regulator [Oribacterium sp. WCC10]|uniref:MurR/RpiR family transcriptional regulator n=1 Tax=Oribacterium sp. WCC10 TaxID=1855343 RepID=UPI0008F2E0A2|nr:MurR/RpiR family transcriptional regulator [Oribacterium sp. WCC10]SFG68819.1 DNA-binding transcriptional regulator, MurR/RpiR family, contains HTH and SIS domains [Oribacterium sp. WCC10]
MNIIDKMEQFKDAYTSNERKLYNVISRNPNIIHSYTISQVAGYAEVSTSAMLRFCKRLGFNGYKEFKYEMESWLHSENIKAFSDEPLQRIANAFSEAIHAIPEYCNKDLQCLANDIIDSDKVIALGRYRNKSVSDKLCMNLTNLGVSCQTASDLLTYEHFEKIITKDTTVIIFSVLHDMKSYINIIEEIAQLTDKFWLVTSTEKKADQLGFRHVTVLPSTSGGTGSLDQQAVMMVFVEMLTYLLRQKI